MPGHGHGWTTAASFVAMWTAMMVAMMLPSLVPVLARSARPLVLTLGYFPVWAAVGVAVHYSPALPLPTGMMLLVAGALQFTTWKAKHLGQYHAMATAGGSTVPRSAAATWRDGFRLGACCVRSCAGPTVALLALGAMDLRVMLLVGAAVTAERLAPRGLLVARATGAAAVIAGLIGAS
jgi:predicted metal-binding membrane protein